MAFAEIRFVKREIEDLLKTSGNSLAASSREILEFADKELDSLQEIAKGLIPWSRADITLRSQISKLGNVLKQHAPQSESSGDPIIPKIHQELVQLKTTGEKYIEELYNSLSEKDDEEEDCDSPRTNSGEEMVGLVYEFNKLKSRLRISWSKSTQVTALVGMAGIGKTTLARKLFEDPNLADHFECRVWVTIGKECKFKEIPRRILAELNGEVIEEGDEDVTALRLKESLKDKRFLIVLDDVWDKYMMYHLHSSYQYERNGLKDALQDKIKGSQILFTTRLHQVDEYNVPHSSGLMIVRLLNEEESWDLLRIRVFGAESYPFQLEKFGKKIVDKCDGLPLIIIAVANLLSEEEKTVEYWAEVAGHKNHQIFMDAYDEILKVLLPSYTYIPKLLRMCFLYMGIFPRKYDISRSKLIDMWDADGFLEEKTYQLLYPSASKCLEELVSSSLVMVNEKTIDDSGRLGAKQIKTCRLHSSLWQLSNKQARKSKFCHVLSTSNDAFGECIESQCRLSFHNNVLFGIKEVCESVEDNCASTAHSLLCYGPLHKYQVPMCFGLRLLRKLDALRIRFYEFPMEVLGLVQLRYLALTLNGELPVSISQLSNLQFLIVNQYFSIRSDEDPVHLPREIWDMKELKQIQVMGSDLPHPCGASLERLLTLSNVSVHSCSEAVLKGMPNLKKLGIQIKLDVDDDNDNGSPLSCFDHISHLSNLKSLKCAVMNPEVVIPSLTPMSIFPRNLTKLSLSGMGYPWKETSKISSLPCLQVLKLRNYAFQGPEWEVEEQAFSLLTILIIEDTDLEDWKIGRGSFDDLETLTMKHCYNLERIHGEFGGFLGGIKLVDCNPLGAVQMKKATQDWKVDVHSSWEDRKHKP
ncbi:putative late blight resistance protein homolog R1A-10 [Salvia miltiorrhiza]|uniref:putative late blight resistance protein homolog R1A-10 n=1 Tax=Salvia miltiorrhiza TaxID=226208 RepID=UPI0025ACE41B|nr:putative late blight resistance protein homolog R1A-10 [Salvia miltiorrhiza]